MRKKKPNEIFVTSYKVAYKSFHNCPISVNRYQRLFEKQDVGYTVISFKICLTDCLT